MTGETPVLRIELCLLVAEPARLKPCHTLLAAGCWLLFMLSRKYSVKEKRIINKLFQQKDNTYYSKFYILKTKKNYFKYPRFVFSISKKLDKRTTKRNYLKRIINEIIQKYILIKIININDKKNSIIFYKILSKIYFS